MNPQHAQPHQQELINIKPADEQEEIDDAGAANQPADEQEQPDDAVAANQPVDEQEKPDDAVKPTNLPTNIKYLLLYPWSH